MLLPCHGVILHPRQHSLDDNGIEILEILPRHLGTLDNDILAQEPNQVKENVPRQQTSDSAGHVKIRAPELQVALKR